MISNTKSEKNPINILVDIEWEHAQNSTGEPLSLAAIRDDNLNTLYTQWPVDILCCSDWTKMHVLPQLSPDKYDYTLCVLQLKKWAFEPNIRVWSSEPQVKIWLYNKGITSFLWDHFFTTEKDIICRWWAKQDWIEKNTQYHSMWDVRGMLHEMNAIIKQ